MGSGADIQFLPLLGCFLPLQDLALTSRRTLKDPLIALAPSVVCACSRCTSSSSGCPSSSSSMEPWFCFEAELASTYNRAAFMITHAFPLFLSRSPTATYHSLKNTFIFLSISCNFSLMAYKTRAVSVAPCYLIKKGCWNSKRLQAELYGTRIQWYNPWRMCLQC